MARTLKTKLEEDFEAAGKAVIEHHFDNHEFCGVWCPRKRLTEKQKKASARYYRVQDKGCQALRCIAEQDKLIHHNR
jgi:hypothetical protein